MAAEHITTRIHELRRREGKYEAKYGADYPTFAHRIARDGVFLEQVEANISKAWEIDLVEWEFCYKGIRDWTLQGAIGSRDQADSNISATTRPYALCAGEFIVPDEFAAPLPKDMIELFEGNEAAA